MPIVARQTTTTIMTKQDVITAMAEEMGRSDYEAREFLDAAIKVMTSMLNHGDDIVIRKFGTFKVKMCPPKKVRNINTGEAFTLGARRKVVFEPGKDITL